MIKEFQNRQIHVGWDAWRRPVHLDEIADIITGFVPVAVPEDVR